MSRFKPFESSVTEFSIIARPSEIAADNTTVFNNAFADASSSGKRVFIPPGTYKITGSLAVGAITIDATGVIIEHYPANDTTDAMVITGLDAGRTIIRGLHIKGMMNWHGYGRDLIRVSKGDYVCLYNVSLSSPKRDALNVRPTASNQWVENMWLENVKVQFPGGGSATLPSTIDSVVTTFVVSSTTGFPDAPFKVQCESETMLVGAMDRTTNTFSSVTRGADSTTAASHTSTKTVTRNTPKLSAGIGTSDTTFTTDWSTVYPEAPFNIKIDDEIITVGAINKSTHTLSSLTRGVEGTTAATHSSAAPVSTWNGRDGFHFEIAGTKTSNFNPFINQVTLTNCETRSTPRHSLMLLNTITSGTNANKMSCFTITGDTELAGEKGAHALVRLQGDTQPIENISFDGCAIENTNGERTGAGIEATGTCSGLFRFENSIVFGTASKILGYDQFPHYFVRDINTSAYTPVYNSHTGISKKVRTASLTAVSGFEDVHTLVDGEWLEVLVTDQNNGGNNKTWFARATVIGRQVMVSASNFNLNCTITEVSGQLRVTNTHASTNKALEVFIMRVHRDTSA